MSKVYEMDLAGRPLKVTVGKVAAQANGAVFIQYGDTTVLCTATASDKPREGIDFFPLSVEFEENSILLERSRVDSIREKEKHRRIPFLRLVLSTVPCVRFSRRITEMT